MKVTGMTVSLKINDTEYGRGSERFVSLKAEAPEGERGADLTDFEGVLEKVMALSLQTWEAIQASRFSGGEIGADELKKLVDVGRKRTAKVVTYLKDKETDATNS